MEKYSFCCKLVFLRVVTDSFTYEHSNSDNVHINRKIQHIIDTFPTQNYYWFFKGKLCY